jgi:hypothetical protein
MRGASGGDLYINGAKPDLNEAKLIPKSASASRMRENADVFNFEITPEDMRTLDGSNENRRTCWDPTNRREIIMVRSLLRGCGDNEMNFLAQIVSKLIFCAGIMITAVSCVLGSALGSGVGRGPFIGVAMMILGAVLWQKSSTKTCLGCAKLVKHHARKCPHCGADLVG